MIGPQRRPVIFRFEAGQEIAGVRVKLEWARYLLGLDPADHVDREHALEATQVGLPASMLEALGATRTPWDAALVLTERARPARSVVAGGAGAGVDGERLPLTA